MNYYRGMGIASIIFGGVAMILTLVSSKKVDNVCDGLNRSIRDFERKDVTIDISEDLIDRVTNRKVEAAVERRMDKAVNKGIEDATKEFKNSIQQEIKSQYTDTKDLVSREIREKAGRIDIQDLRKDVIESFRKSMEYELKDILNECKEEAKDRFTDKLESVIDDYDGRFDDIGEFCKALIRHYNKRGRY